MQDLVGIIRRRDELEEALTRLERLRARAARAGVTGSRVYNPGWHLALDLENLIGVCEAVTRSALVREESRGGHTREDFPKADAKWGGQNVVIRKRDGRLQITTEPIAKVPAELAALLGEDKPSGEAATGAQKTAVAAGDD
jgi:succinate dehydrogenase / fumarate reductase flavoprotein subunit